MIVQFDKLGVIDLALGVGATGMAKIQALPSGCLFSSGGDNAG